MDCKIKSCNDVVGADVPCQHVNGFSLPLPAHIRADTPKRLTCDMHSGDKVCGARDVSGLVVAQRIETVHVSRQRRFSRFGLIMRGADPIVPAILIPCTGRPALGVGRNQIKGAVRRVRPTNRFFIRLFIAATGRFAPVPGTPAIMGGPTAVASLAVYALTPRGCRAPPAFLRAAVVHYAHYPGTSANWRGDSGHYGRIFCPLAGQAGPAEG